MPPTKIITDSSFLYSLYNTQDSLHDSAVNIVTHSKSRMVIPDVVLPEVGFLFLRDVGYRGVQKFLEALNKANPQLLSIDNLDLSRAYEISVEYGSAQFDVVDCCIMALAERLKITQVATFDRRDFSIFRPRHCAYLELLP